jgi:serine/threonine-protein kinase
MNSANVDRNLLYAALAVQMGFLDRDALIAAMMAWTAHLDKPLAQILIERKALDPSDHPPIEAAVRRHLEKHGENPSHCLDSLGFEVVESVRGLLRTVHDADLPGEATRLDLREHDSPGSDRDRTTAYAPAWVPGDSQASEIPSTPDSDSRLSRFQVLRPHARGGLGEVHVAWDKELGREVALKEIRVEYARNPKARARFVREAEVNANLEHPGIVPVYALGTHPDGRPYYAMRFVRGETLQAALERLHAEAADRHPAAWRVRLRPLLSRFLVICEAIEYAHDRGVLHRDLKPANIMLGTFGETLIIDWGLAKVLGQPDTGERTVGEGEDRAGPVVVPSSQSGSLPTAAGETLGTPAFMSPEQVHGGAIGVASDVYGLGATLYAVLTGRPPVRGGKAEAIFARVVKGEIDPLRTDHGPVPRGLEAICLKAMALRPEDRYGSARALAEDLERWLADEPVSVHPDPPSTRVRRWAQRNKAVVAASLGLLLATLAGLALTTAIVGEQKRRAEAARERAEAAQIAAETARQVARDSAQVGLEVVDQLVTLGDRQLLTLIPPADRQRFLAAALNFVERFRRFDPEDLETGIKTGLVARRLANLYRVTGQFDQAEPFHAQSVRVFDDLAQRHPENPRVRNLLAEALIDQGKTHLARGRAPLALAALNRAADLARRGVQRFPREANYQRTLAQALFSLAGIHAALGRDDAAVLGRQAAAVLQPLADAGLPNLRAQILPGRPSRPLADQHALVSALMAQAEALEASGRTAEGEGPLRQALERMERVASELRGLELTDVDFYHARAATRLARALIAGTQVREAVELLDGARDRLDALANRQPETLPIRIALIEVHTSRADARWRVGDERGAVEDAETARDQLGPLLEEHPQAPELPALMAEALALLARDALRTQPPRTQEARTLLTQALTHLDNTLKLNPTDPIPRRRRADYLDRLEQLGSGPAQGDSPGSP